MQVVTASGQVLSEITIEELEELSRKAGAPSLCVHRADLLRTFAEALELSVIRTNATCVGFEQHSDVVTARFADGQSESGDLLLGADGIQSAFRAQLFGPSEPRYAGYTCWRGIAHFEHPDLPSGLSLFAVGRGTQMGSFHCGPDRIYWFVTQNAPAGIPKAAGGTVYPRDGRVRPRGPGTGSPGDHCPGEPAHRRRAAEAAMNIGPDRVPNQSRAPLALRASFANGGTCCELAIRVSAPFDIGFGGTNLPCVQS